jgi:hypothetical protein
MQPVTYEMTKFKQTNIVKKRKNEAEEEKERCELKNSEAFHLSQFDRTCGQLKLITWQTID